MRDLFQINQLYPIALHSDTCQTPVYAFNLARELFERVSRAGKFNRFVRKLSGQRASLQDFASLLQSGEVLSGRYLGQRAVAINQITGTEGKSGDFDITFAPISPRSRERWVRLACAKLCGDPIPPVELILVNGNYYVRDGHHRISVSRVLGELEIDAIVYEYILSNASASTSSPASNAPLNHSNQLEHSFQSR